MIGVIVTWSLIIINFVKGTSPKALHGNLSKLSPAGGDNILKDSFHLLNDYPDPFIPQTDSMDNDSFKTVPLAGISHIHIATDSLERVNVNGMIQLNGIIGLAGHKKMLGLVTINGQSYIVKEGQIVENFAIKKIEKNSLKVMYKRRFYKIVKSPK